MESSACGRYVLRCSSISFVLSSIFFMLFFLIMKRSSVSRKNNRYDCGVATTGDDGVNRFRWVCTRCSLVTVDIMSDGRKKSRHIRKTKSAITQVEENGVGNDTNKPWNGENRVIVHELGRSLAVSDAVPTTVSFDIAIIDLSSCPPIEEQGHPSPSQFSFKQTHVYFDERRDSEDWNHTIDSLIYSSTPEHCLNNRRVNLFYRDKSTSERLKVTKAKTVLSFFNRGWLWSLAC